MHNLPLTSTLFLAAACVQLHAAEVPLPKVLDERLKIDLVAAEPDIVTPTGITVDSRGRVLCVENHTHFPKEEYDGPSTDRIKMFEDTDGDHRPDRITTFFEGTANTMSLAACHDGSIYVATRSEIFRLRDGNDDGKADDRTTIVNLDTAGDYPHNGLSGFAFDFFGSLYFGFGENLGAPYKIIGTDGTTLEGGGEGGNIYRCQLDGRQLEQISTGFWNPFHLCLDSYDRVFTVDNDPDWRPPCRLIHIVPGGDYGYRYSLGRRGIHPFTSWFGELPGTLGMVAGTAEAPSGVISYDSDNLPDDYRHDLITTSWSVHVIERFRLKRQGATFTSLAQTIVKGGEDFRPVSVALAPDGSLYFSDWADYSYNVHGKGRIWRLSRAEETPPVRSTDPAVSIRSRHRPWREKAARNLLRGGESGLKTLRAHLRDTMPEVRATALKALVVAGDNKEIVTKALRDDSSDVRELALSILPRSAFDPVGVAKKTASAPERAAAIRRARGPDGRQAALELLTSEDPFVQQAARYALADASVEELLKSRLSESAGVRLNIALLLRGSGEDSAETAIPDLLKDKEARVRFVAAKWIGEEILQRFEPQLLAGLKSDELTPKVFDAILASIELLRDSPGQKVEDELQQLTADLLRRGQLSPSVTALALRKLRGIETKDLGSSGSAMVSVEQLTKYTNHADARVRLEAVRCLREATDDPRHQAALLHVANDASRSATLRAATIVGLSPDDPESRQALMALATGDVRSLRDEALRSLRGAALSDEETLALRAQLSQVESTHPESSDLIRRLLQPDWRPGGRPKPEETDRWLRYFDAGGVDAAAGERLFFHARGPLCFRCHQVDGRGGAIGPDLSSSGQLSDRRLVESIVTPSREMAPRYVPWTIVSSKGQVFTGVLVGERGEDEFYADANAGLIRINHTHIERREPSAKSIMPDRLVDQMTDRELRDLLAYLKGRR